MTYKRMWVILALITGVGFAIVGYLGQQIYVQAPPIPSQVISTDNQVLFTKADINRGQVVWQSIGGHELGTIWGHGAYLAPDWTADWLHKEAIAILNIWATQDFKTLYESLDEESKALLRTRLQKEIRTNTYNEVNGSIVVSPSIATAIKEVGDFYANLFGDDPKLAELRIHYAMPDNTVANDTDRRSLTAFFFWASWACVTERPGEIISYTNNWPAERLVGNTPPPMLVMISVLSVVLLLAGIGSLAFYYAFYMQHGYADLSPAQPPQVILTPSMKGTQKFFFVVAVMMLLQIGCGILTAHYTVEGTTFFGLPLAQWLPYTLTRTWHLQLALFWIITALLSTGLYVAPLISGVEPKYQLWGVNFIFWASIIIVAGSLVGEYLAINHHMPLNLNFWFGHQGYEYIDLGRFWQSLLYLGFIVWLILMLRAIIPVIKQKLDNYHLLILLAITTVIIGLFYGFGFLWGPETNLAVVEYWRFWVVHMWVEGFFEVFSTILIAYLFLKLGLLNIKIATTSALMAASIYMLGGIIGMLHHLYFSGTPIVITAFGGIFSALEVVPLALIGFEAHHNYSLSKAQPWVKSYKWPIYFFIAVCFWNLVGAGLFGFLINMPISLYYLQGLNTTPLHSHGALFGVYGNLSIGLILFCLRGLTVDKVWNNIILACAFWFLNLGLAAMCFLSLLPIGLIQAWSSIANDMWYARSAEFTHSSLIHDLIWVRTIGDVLFTLGALALIWFIFQIGFAKQKLTN